MEHPHILSEKLRIPAASGLRRGRLEDPLRGEDGPGLTVVCAPAGSGKSTLLAAVAAGADVPVAWYRVSAGDAPAALPSHLAAAFGGRIEGLRGPPLDAAAGLGDLLTTLDRNQYRCLLIIDDVHELIGTPAEKALAEFVWLRPRCVRVLLGCRRPPDLNLPMLRSRGEVREIGAEELRFRVWEVEELFAVVHRRPLRPEAAAALTRRTGGWAAGLQLFHLATADKNTAARQQAVQALGPRAQTIRGYLARNVLEQLDETRRYFLVHTSALGLLSGPLCDALLDRTDSAAVLEALERDQVFTTSDDDGLTYRYHEVLQRHLEFTLVSERGAAGARRWYARAAKLLLAAGAVRDALRAYALAEDWVSVAALGRRESEEVTAAVTVGSDELFPRSVLCDDPWLAFADARRRLRHGALADAVTAFQHAATLSDDAVFRAACTAEAAAASTWLPARPNPPAARGAGSSRWTDQLREAVRSDRFRTDANAGPLARGLTALVQGRFPDARRDLQTVADAEPEVSVPWLVAELATVIAEIAGAGCNDAVHRLEQVATAAADAGYPWMERVARGVLLAWLGGTSAAPWSLAAGQQLVADCERSGDPWGAAVLQLANAIASAARSDPDASRHLSDAAARLRALDAAVVADTATAIVELSSATSCSPSGEHQPAAVAVRCFGGLGITVNRRALRLDALRPRAVSLLRLLVLDYGARVHRERLIDLLWPDASLPVGLRRLQVAVSSLRQVLAPLATEHGETVRRDGDSYVLLLPGAEVDVHRFERLLSTANTEPDRTKRTTLRQHALDLYRGDLFPEAGSAEYVVSERERLRVCAAEAATALAADQLAAGQAAAAVATSRRSLALNPYSDVAWHALVSALDATGDDTAATRARQEHRHVLADLERGLAASG